MRKKSSQSASVSILRTRREAVTGKQTCLFCSLCFSHLSWGMKTIQVISDVAGLIEHRSFFLNASFHWDVTLIAGWSTDDVEQ